MFGSDVRVPGVEKRGADLSGALEGLVHHVGIPVGVFLLAFGRGEIRDAAFLERRAEQRGGEIDPRVELGDLAQCGAGGVGAVWVVGGAAVKRRFRREQGAGGGGGV